MAKFAVIFVAAIAFHGVFAAPGTSPAETTGEAATIIGNLFKDIAAEVQKYVPDPKDIVDTATKNSNELATNLESILKKWKVEAENHKGEFSGAAEKVVKKLTVAVEDLKKLATPAEGTHAAEIKAKFDNTVKDLTVAGDKLKDDLKPLFKQAEENLVSFGKFLSDGFWSAEKFVKSQLDTTKPETAPQA